MKASVLFILLFSFSTVCISQESQPCDTCVTKISQPSDLCSLIYKLDQYIYKLDRGEAPNEDEKQISHCVKYSLYSLLNFKHNDINDLVYVDSSFNLQNFILKLDCITTVETITWLEHFLSKSYKKKKKEENLIRYPYGVEKKSYPKLFLDKEILEKTRSRANDLIKEEFSLYGLTDHSQKNIKYLLAEHSNDIFSFPKFNDDRDYTGGFRFEFGTDKLKMRLFTSKKDKWWHINSRSWYSYQSLFFGGEGYTPYLRDTIVFCSATSVDSTDRPYASVVYFGRAKYRVFRKGQVKIKSEIKIGRIGVKSPEKIQALVHRDLTISALRPRGWEAQIANGGRLAYNINIAPEFMLLSKDRSILKRFNKHSFRMKVPEYINLSLLAEVQFGHMANTQAVGLNFSTQNFKRSGGINIPMHTKRDRNIFIDDFNLTSKLIYKHVSYNSMLQGYGISRPRPDEDPDSPGDAYVLLDSQVKKHLFMWDIGIYWRLRYCAIYFKHRIHSPEYDLPINDSTFRSPKWDPNNTDSHNASIWNHTGTIGLVFLINN